MSTTSVHIELQRLSRATTALSFQHNGDDHSRESSHVEQQEEVSLPPTDEGKAAWLVLAGCCLIQAPVWGFPLAFGVFQEYYTSGKADIRGSTTSISIIGTLASGILYLSSPIMFTLLTRYPYVRKYCGPVGLSISIFALVLSSFGQKAWQLIATQGILCAIGSGLMYSPTTLYLDEWFLRRKGLAYGIMGSAKSLTGVILPFVMSASLDRFGFRNTLRGWAVALFLLTAPLLRALKPRKPSSAARSSDWSFLKSRVFWMLQVGNIIQSLGYFLPTTYLASYASRIGLSKVTGTLMLSVLNGTSVFGSALLGILNDHIRVTSVILISTIGSSLAVFLFWGLYEHAAMLAVFAAAYGFFAGGFSSTWPGILNELQSEIPQIDTGLVYGLLAGGRGVGNVVSGPLSVALLSANWPAADSGMGKAKPFGLDTEYGPLIVFTGITAFFGGWGWLSRTTKWLR